MSGIVFNYAFMLTAVLLLGGISGYLCERAGIVNIGIDGMMCFGAIFFGIFSSPKVINIGPAGIIFALLLATICTSITGLLHGFATIKLKANHIISGTAIDLVGVALATFINEPLGLSLYGTTKLQSGINDFLYIGGSVYGSALIMFALAIVIAVIIFVIINFTKVGLRYKAVGENPAAVDSLGINPIKYQWIAVILGSMAAGMAGGIFLFNVKQFPGSCQGYGYLSLAILIVGAWKIEWISLASFIFAVFTSLSMSSVLTNLGFPREVALALPYMITVVVLLFFSKWVRAPEHDGIPYERQAR